VHVASKDFFWGLSPAMRKQAMMRALLSSNQSQLTRVDIANITEVQTS